MKHTRFILALFTIGMLVLLAYLGKAEVVAYPIVMIFGAYAGAKTTQHTMLGKENMNERRTQGFENK